MPRAEKKQKEPKAPKAPKAPKKAAGGEEELGIMKKKKSVSKSERAGLTFPVARLNKHLKTKSKMKRVGSSAPVYLTALVEYVAAELLDAAGNKTKDAGRKTVSIDDLCKGLRTDKDLSRLFASNSIFMGEKLTKVSDAITYMPKSRPVKSGGD